MGTYILFSQVPLARVAPPSSSHQRQSDSAQHRLSSSQPLVRPSSLQQRPSANTSSAARSTAAETGRLRAAPRDSAHAAQPSGSFTQPNDYDSDDSQVKTIMTRRSDDSLEWQGQTFCITGKESALHILRDTFSVRSVMKDGQLQLLVHHVGDFVNNYTADVFKMCIIPRHAKSALLAGMNLNMNANHDLDRFQSLACFDIKEMQDNFYFKKYSFPDAHRTWTHVASKLRRIISGFVLGKVINWCQSCF